MCIEGFPLVQGVQTKYAGLLQVVLVDVDPAFGTPAGEFLPKAKRILDGVGVAWTNTLAKEGFNETQRLLNVGGYATTFVDHHGIVRATELFGDELEKLVDRDMKEWMAERLKAGRGAAEAPRDGGGRDRAPRKDGGR